MVTAAELIEQTRIPRQALYRLIRQKRIPVKEVTQPWHTRPQYRFCVAEVRAALGLDAKPAP